MKCQLRKARQFYNDKYPNDHITQAELARRVGTSRQTIALLEAGKTVPNVTLAILIGRALKSRVDSIFVVPKELADGVAKN